jgi:hypothetical protein
MAWELTVRLPKKENEIGSVSATWTDPTLGVFMYSRTSRVGVAQADAFIAEAIAARDAWQTYQMDNNTKSAWVLDRLNTADPKVV